MAKQKEQPTLPGIPEATPTNMWRINFQYQGPNFLLRAGSLIIPANTIAEARNAAWSTLGDLHGGKWFNITAIKQITAENSPPPF